MDYGLDLDRDSDSFGASDYDSRSLIANIFVTYLISSKNYTTQANSRNVTWVALLYILHIGIVLNG